MAQLKVDTDSIGSTAHKFRTDTEDLSNIMQSIKNDISNLEQTWQGSAHNAFQACMDQWERDIKQVKDTLDTVVRNMDKSGPHYQETEQQVQQLFNF